MLNFGHHLTLALPPLTLEGAGSMELDPYGFQFDNIEAISQKFVAVVMPVADVPPVYRPYAEYSGVGPEADQGDYSELVYQLAKYRIERENKKKDTFDTWGACQ
ncbi:MAG: hypothetical protein VYE18_05090 [Pseudomonadota bacterium]|nr:hypothetical protein [Pseudomonadota bacterium]